MKQTIFIVEDDADISGLVVHLLEAEDFRVRAFGRTSTVLAEAERSRPASFLLDIMLPGGDGLELCRRIRKHKQSKYTYVIIITALIGKKDYLEGMEAGADDFVTKSQFGDALMPLIQRRFLQPQIA